MTALALIDEAKRLGLTLWAKDNGKLGFKPEGLCLPEFKDKLKAHKAELLALLQAKGVTWIEVYSQALSETIFFCEDENTKALLVEAGADPWSIYTRAELEVLVANNRAKPFIPDELIRFHAAKRTFGAKIQKSFTERGKRQCQQ
jgi:hypothetical protein